MSRLTLEEYLNERINNVNTYIEFNERKGDKDFFAYKELELYQMAEKYMKLTDELGCPLEVVFKAIRNGIWFKSDDFITENLEKDLATRPRLYYSDDFKCYRFEIGFGLHYVALKDYQKTWWLKDNRSE